MLGAVEEAVEEYEEEHKKPPCERRLE